MTGYLTKSDGWMNYYLHIDGHEKPRRIYWRNHNCSYIKLNGGWVRVYFNYNILDCMLESGSGDRIPMVLNAEGEWEMARGMALKYNELFDEVCDGL